MGTQLIHPGERKREMANATWHQMFSFDVEALTEVGAMRKSRRLLAALSMDYGIRQVGMMHGSNVVAKDGIYYTLHDNGGEININKINSGELTISIPSTGKGLLSAETVAYRIANAINGIAIDWDYVA